MSNLLFNSYVTLKIFSIYLLKSTIYELYYYIILLVSIDSKYSNNKQNK